MIQIIVSTEPRRPNSRRSRFIARLAVDGRVLGAFSTPLCGAARVLASEGVPADTVLQMRHAGSDVVALAATVGVAAGLTVEEEGLRFVKWHPFDRGSIQEAAE